MRCPSETANACAAAALLAAPHRPRDVSSPVHPVSFPCSGCLSHKPPSMFHCLSCRCALRIRRPVMQCQSVLQFPSLVCCLLEDDSLKYCTHPHARSRAVCGVMSVRRASHFATIRACGDHFEARCVTCDIVPCFCLLVNTGGQ
jgi:hypothetical protein